MKKQPVTLEDLITYAECARDTLLLIHIISIHKRIDEITEAAIRGNAERKKKA